MWGIFFPLILLWLNSVQVCQKVIQSNGLMVFPIYIVHKYIHGITSVNVNLGMMAFIGDDGFILIIFYLCIR